MYTGIHGFYLLSLYNDDTSCVIGLDSHTLQGAQSAKAWQKQGFPDDDYTIGTRIGKDTFICCTTGKNIKVHNGAYTPEAWERFLNTWKDNNEKTNNK